MSTITIFNGRVSSADWNKPTKKYDPGSGEFSYLVFEVQDSLAKKNKDSQYLYKKIKYRCYISKEYKADEFLKQFNDSPEATNYILISDAKLGNFEIEKIEKTGRDDKKYSIDAYSGFTLYVENFSITQKLKIKHQEPENIETNVQGDEIPF